MIKKLFLSLLILLTVSAQASTSWHDNKYSMFIHFGLYSVAGGVWEGKPVKIGYSEQIQAHAGIYADVYAQLSEQFDPKNFNADSIVALAKSSGMRSIVLTSKHHDGFCLFHTETTDFNSFDSSPCKRDFVAELSDACRRGGVNFGLYFSLIDWHQPGGSNITYYNTNSIPELLHKLNLAQIEELVTRYGKISELWFDMGSLTPGQSKELYALVKQHQPDCMISGRLGNGQYDFAVMSDNFYPESSLQTAWQAPASMFDETWGYRSWQERGDSHLKAVEKLKSLIRVVSGGGNFILNVGPSGDGAVLPWEAAVLSEIGGWLDRNGDVIYSCDASPYRTPFDWGCVTRKGCSLNLILFGTRPADDKIVISAPSGRLVKVQGPAKASLKKGKVCIDLNPSAYCGEIGVVRLEFSRPVQSEAALVLNERVARSSYFCQDYHSNARSEVGYSWNVVPSKGKKGLAFEYAVSDIGKEVSVSVGGKECVAVLSGENKVALDYSPVEESGRIWCNTVSHSFSDHYLGERLLTSWSTSDDPCISLSGRPFDCIVMMETISSPCDQEIVLEIGAGNGVDLYVNDVLVMRHLNPYRCAYREESVIIHLKKGDNKVAVRSFNRNERELKCKLKVSDDQAVYRTAVESVSLSPGRVNSVAVSRNGTDSPHRDCELHNLKLVVQD